MMFSEFLAAVLGYLLGSVPYGLLLTRMAGLGDIRAIGSGSIGATNVLRTGNRKLAAATLVFDVAKGAVALLLARLIWGEQAAMIAGFAAMLGHCFPVWLGFRGGKGVATAAGVILAAMPGLGLLLAAIWLTMALLTRISSLSALVTCAVAPVVAALGGNWPLAGLCAGLAVVIALRHRANIARLIAGTEPKIGARPKSVPKGQA